jgi:phage tail-like protein
MKENHLLTAFHFRVLFRGLESKGETDFRFQSVAGIKAINLNPVVEKRSIATQFGPVILTRAIEGSVDSPLRQWILENLNKSSPGELPEVLIEVLNEEHKPEIIIRLKKVTVAGWQLGELHAEKSELLMEEITLHYQSIGMDMV